jgi:intracellular sulfur oxidation DsrE/DsrF family protein
MRYRHAAIQCLLALVVSSAGAAGLAMDSSQRGVIREASDAPGRPTPGHVYKFVFAMNTPEDATLGFNPGLRALSTLIEEYVSYGIDAGHRSIVVVLNGTNTSLALTDASYRRIHAGQENPSLKQIQALGRLGVVFTVPAGDIASLSMSAKDVQPGVSIGPRASIVYLDLESEGYVYSGLKSLITE